MVDEELNARDLCAMFAMVGYIIADSQQKSMGSFDEIADRSYLMADAMIDARSVKFNRR